MPFALARASHCRNKLLKSVRKYGAEKNESTDSYRLLQALDLTEAWVSMEKRIARNDTDTELSSSADSKSASPERKPSRRNASPIASSMPPSPVTVKSVAQTSSAQRPPFFRPKAAHDAPWRGMTPATRERARSRMRSRTSVR